MEIRDVNRRSLLVCGSMALNSLLVASTGVASAARLPTSTLVVDILSVDRESSDRREVQYPGQPAVAFETTKYIAKAQIAKALKTDHGLSAGVIVDVRYSVTVRHPPDPAFRVRPMLSAGETVTLTVFGAGTSFYLR